MDDLKAARRLLVLLAAAAMLGWALLAFVMLTSDREPEGSVQLVVRQVPAEVEDVPTPVLDSFVDWDQVEADNVCLWELLQAADVELSVEVVFAFGDWADVQGGPCAVLERETDG